MTEKTYGRVWLEGDEEWGVQAEPHIILRLKRVFQKIAKGEHGTCHLSATVENARDLLWFIGRYPMEMSPADRDALQAGSTRHREHVLLLEQMIDPSYVPRPAPLAIPPRDYQLRACEMYLSQGFLLLCDELGTGKTCSAICSMTDERTLPAVVVAYPHLQHQWADEVRKFAPHLRTHIIKQSTPYELPKHQCPRCMAKRPPKRKLTSAERDDDEELFDDECPDPDCGRGPDVIIVTYTKLSGWAETLAAYAKSVIFDEGQELRHSGSNKYAAAVHLAAACQFKLCATATPIFNYGGEIFNILNVLSPGCLGDKAEFSREWCPGSSHDNLKVHDPKAFGTYLRENFLMLRRTRADIGRELPAVIKVPHRIDADQKALDEVEDSAAELAKIILSHGGESFKGERMQAAEELSNMLRQATGIAKAPYAADFARLVVESGEKVVLAGWHRSVYAIWAAKLKDLGVAWYTGSESPGQKVLSKEDFLRPDGPKVLMLSLRSGAGLDGLQDVCKTIVIGELDWSPAVIEQIIGRLHRDGQDHHVTAYILLSETGADPVMAETLGLKREQLEGIRNPKQNLIERLETNGGNARKLAEDFLAKTRKRARTSPRRTEEAA